VKLGFYDFGGFCSAVCDACVFWIVTMSLVFSELVFAVISCLGVLAYCLWCSVAMNSNECLCVCCAMEI
jgi:hypothetical protein